MAGARGFAFRILLAAAVALGGWAAWVSTFGTPAPAEALPAGAAALFEVRDAASVVDRLSGTKFAAAFAKSATAAWLERTEAVRAYDALLADVGAVARVRLGRSNALHLVGRDAAVAWYPAAPGGLSADAPWVAAGRLSLTAWATAGALRVADRFAARVGIARSDVAGRALYSLPVGAGESLHLFLAGRLLVAGTDRGLVEGAARASRGGASLAREPGVRSLRDALPARGEVFAWTRDRALAGGIAAPSRTGDWGVAVGVRVGSPLEIDLVAEPAVAAAGGAGAGASLPALGVLKGGPLLFLSSRLDAPPAFGDLLRERQRLAAARSGAAAGPPLVPKDGFAFALTGAAPGAGLIPAPRGLLAIGMGSDAAARAALPQLFPRGARSSTVGGLTALASRESIPLAGDFELLGAAVGPLLVFATEPALLSAVAGASAPAGAAEAPDKAWRVDTVAEFSVEQTLPLLGRWATPLSGLVSARWPDAPDISRDLALLGAVRTVRATVGTDGRRDRALVAVHVRDLP